MDVESQLSELVVRILGRRLVLEEKEIAFTQMNDWDSLVHMQIILHCEEIFNVEFSQEEIRRLTSFSSIVSTLQEKV